MKTRIFYNEPMQEFTQQTLASMFIQNLLASTWLPICNTVRDGDYIIQNCHYIYNHNFIKCTRSGYINIEEIPALYPNDTLYPAEDLFPSDGKKKAQFEILRRYEFGKYYPNLTYKHIPNTNYYDSETHIHLGKYLRCLRDIYNVNYMPYYNCNSNLHLHNINNNYKYPYIYTIPIMFNKIYTMSYDLLSSIKIHPILYSTKPMNVLQLDNLNLYNILNKEETLSGRSYSDLYKFGYYIDDAVQYRKQRYLYMLIGTSEKIDSLSVLEGNYHNCNNVKIGTLDDKPEPQIYIDEKTTPMYGKNATCRPDGTADDESFDVFGELKLLSTLQRDKSYAFSNRLLEGLLKHTINNQEEICWNIGRVLNKLGLEFNNIWTNEIKVNAFRDYMYQHDPSLCYQDISGNIDKEIEWFMWKGEI